MPEKFPVYRIPDFTAAQSLPQGFYVVDLQQHRQKHAFVQAPHKHDFYLLLYVRLGQGTHTIDFTTYQIQPHSLFFLTPGQVHAWELSEDTQGTLLFFSPDFFINGLASGQLRQFPFFRTWQHPPVLYATAPALTKVESLFQELVNEYATRQALQTEALRANLELLLVHLHRLYPESTPAQENSAWTFQLYQLQGLVEQHYRQHHPVSFYADALHLTAKHLNALCKENLGKTTSDLLQERLILEAKRLLVHSPHFNMAQIATTLGFEDNSYFSRFFKKATGCTPEQFRRQE